MATVEINSGICGFTTTVKTQKIDFRKVNVTITSSCPHVNKLAQELTEVDPFREITHKGEGPSTFALARTHLPHACCAVPSGIIKAIEVAAGLALPGDASIHFVDKE